MSQSLYVAEVTKIAGADLSAKQFYIVKPDSTAEQVVLAAAATNKLLGVLQNTPKSGEAANVRILGTSKVIAGGSVTDGAWVTSDASGKGVATTTDKDVVVGMAMEAASSGDIFEVLLVHFTLSA
jgi:hypothetical protein